MNTHSCNKEAEISEIHTIVKALNKTINGNGKEGMYQEWQKFKGALYIIGILVGMLTVEKLVQIIKIYIGG